MEDDTIILGRELGKKIVEALGLDNKKVRRIIIDMQVNEPVTIYTELYGTRKLLEIDYSSLADAYIIGYREDGQEFEDEDYEGVETA